MRIARIATDAGPRYAVACGLDWVEVADPFASTTPLAGAHAHPIASARLLAPVEPRVVVGISHNLGVNEHPLPIQAFQKSPRTVVGPDDDIVRMAGVGTVIVEGELAVVIGRTARRLTLENALDAVFGYTIGNDVTNVDQVRVDEKFFQVKNGDGYTPIGPWIETGITDPDDVATVMRVNGRVTAESGSANLPSTIAAQLVYVTSWLTLGPGDIVLTGAPGTSTEVVAGDEIEVALAGLGTLSNRIVDPAGNSARAVPIVVMGVSGCGKSTVGLDLAMALGREFVDADDLHPPENKAKMAAGNALDDDDRWPWLDVVGDALAHLDGRGLPPVVACSALKRAYRDRLRSKAPGAFFVLLSGTRELLESRIGPRAHEYMPATLLDSQLATLEPLGDDEPGLVVDIAPPPTEVTANALAGI